MRVSLACLPYTIVIPFASVSTPKLTAYSSSPGRNDSVGMIIAGPLTDAAKSGDTVQITQILDGGADCPSPLELGHYFGRERGIGHGEEATFRRRHLEAAA